MARTRILFHHQLQTVLVTLFGVSLWCTAEVAVGQIVPDNTLGDESSAVVEIDDSTDGIIGGATRGANLFHSFEEFNVNEGRGVVFDNPAGIENILTRVTGGNVSEILGALGVDGNANLFLINPNGITFGPDASLLINGSFVASTADSILFNNEFEFSATNPTAPPLLTVNTPVGLGFRDNPGEIINRSFAQNSVGEFVGLEVAPGENLALVGGNITFEAGEATARGGNVELGGLSTAGTVSFNDDGSLNFPEDVAKADVILSNAADVDVQGTGGGSITINARNLDLEGMSFIRAGIIADSTFFETPAGNITINVSDKINVDKSIIRNEVYQVGVGNAGDVTITTGSLSLTNSGQVDASTYGQGNAGSVEIIANNTITVDGGGITSGVGSEAVGDAGGVTINTSFLSLTNSGLISAGTLGQGDAGGVTITTDSLSLTNSGRVDADTLGQGNAGSVEITATDTITVDGSSITSLVDSEAVGDAGGVTIMTGSLSIINSGQVDASTSGQGNAGSVEITATDTITVDDGSIISAVDSEAVGDAGGVTINTSFLSLTNSGLIDAGTLGQGDAGGVTITTDSLSLANSGVVSASTYGQGNAGSVEIIATDTITVDGGGIISAVGSEAVGDAGGVTITTGSLSLTGVISAGTLGQGDAGGVTITTDSLSLTNGGRVDSSTFGQGNAGSVEITATDIITVDGGGIVSLVGSEAVGDAGGVTITTGSLSLTNSGFVNADTYGQGNAGSVEIIANDTITVDDGSITSGVGSEAVGDAGGVTITTGSLSLTGVISAGTLGQGDAGGVTITTDSLSLTNGGRVDSSTFGQGNAGSVEITATDIITVDDSSITSLVGSEAVGDAGDVTITTGSLSIINSGQVDASTSGQGNAGSVEIIANDTITVDDSSITSAVDSEAVGNAGGVTITTGSLSLTNGGVVDASTLGQGNAGNVVIDASESILISNVTEDNRSGIFANALVNKGNGGSINVFTNQLTIEDGGTIEVSNFDSFGNLAPGTGEPGNINIEADSVSLNNQARIDAATQSQTGNNANINLQLSEDLTLRHNSLISARALEGANGGNVSIDARFIIAFPSDGSGNDIIATAERGTGGNINLEAQQIFNLEQRNAINTNGDLLNNSTNDLDASSNFSFDGVVETNTLDVDPGSGLVELPENVVDPDALIGQNACRQGRESSLVVTGRGGLPPSSNPNTVNQDLIQVNPIIPLEEKLSHSPTPSTSTETSSEPSIVPAQGWVVDEQGEIYLVSYNPANTNNTRKSNSTSCQP